MKNLLNSFFISPVAVLFIVLLSYTISFIFFSDNLISFTELWGPIDILTYICYFVLFYTLFLYKTAFQTKYEKNIWLIFCFFALAAFLREAGIQHWLTTTDTTAFKLRFFTDPNNPILEKIIAFFCLAVITGLFIYAMTLFLIPAFKGFFLKKPGSWTIITLLSTGALSKIVDRLPGNLKKIDIILDRNGILFAISQICEETLEMTLPILGVIALSQFHLDKKLFFPHTPIINKTPS